MRTTCCRSLAVLAAAAWLSLTAVACESGGGSPAADTSGGLDGADVRVPDAGDPEEVAGADDVAPPPDGADASQGEDVGPACVCEDDLLLCTRESCDETGACVHEEIAFTGGDGRGTAVPGFALADVNPESATNGDRFTLEGLTSTHEAVVLVFHSADCASCWEQGKAARGFVAGLDPAVFFASVNSPQAECQTCTSEGCASAPDGQACAGGTCQGGACSFSQSVLDYVLADPESVEGDPPPSTWPYLQDTAEQDVWGHACAATNLVLVIDAGGLLRYARAVNFADPPFVAELRSAVDQARTPLE